MLKDAVSLEEDVYIERMCIWTVIPLIVVDPRFAVRLVLTQKNMNGENVEQKVNDNEITYLFLLIH